MTDQPLAARTLAADSEHIVTASALVRQFGIWQERAAKAPVYVLHRGRPRLVLTSIDVMEALCVPHEQATERQPQSVVLLDGVEDLVVFFDNDTRITTMGRAARVYFKAPEPAGATLSQIAPGAAAAFLEEAVRRVTATGLAETIEVAALRYADRQLAATIAPCPGGAVLFARDVSRREELRRVAAGLTATDQALTVLADVAAVRINLRGYLEAPTRSLAALTGVSLETLENVRFVTLVELASRVALGDAIEAVIADGDPRWLSATLLVNRAEPRPVRIGLSALRRQLAIDGVVAVVVGEVTGKRDG